MRRTLLLATALLILIKLPLVFALSCTHLDATKEELCAMINNLDATPEEKEALTTMALYQDRTIPNHDFVNFWNTRLNINNAPYSVSKQENGIIKDAWIKILAVMPSVLENGKLYGDTQGKIQSAYNYRVKIPSNTAVGDCKTRYSLENNNHQLNIFVNDILVGNFKLSSFNVDKTNNNNLVFKAQLNIETTTKIEHFKERRYCCKRNSEGKCKKYCNSCDYFSTERKTDNLVIEDRLKTKIYLQQPEGKFKIIDYYNDVTKGRVEATNYTRLLLSFDKSSYAHNIYAYDFMYNLAPYNIITLRAKLLEEKQSQNIKILPVNASALNFIVSDLNNCKLKLFTHFKETIINCNTIYEPKIIQIKTDKLHYYVNDTIFVNITPKNIVVNLTYGNMSILTQNEASFIANPLYNRISASYQDESVESLISVTKKDRLVLAWKIFLFSMINYTVFSFLTRSSWILRWLNVGYST